jgi:hypothetical protein
VTGEEYWSVGRRRLSDAGIIGKSMPLTNHKRLKPIPLRRYQAFALQPWVGFATTSHQSPITDY